MIFLLNYTSIGFTQTQRENLSINVSLQLQKSTNDLYHVWTSKVLNWS